MSASLVGSEMCIRDRHCLNLPEAMCVRHVVSMCRRSGPPVGSFGQSPKAVSYTHLTLPTICSV
eukprot:6591622-Alexandrium_andersonii.AAC.1